MSGIAAKILESQKKTDERRQKIKQLVNMVCGLVSPNSIAEKAEQQKLSAAEKRFAVFRAHGFFWHMECTREYIAVWAYFHDRPASNHQLLHALWGDKVKDLPADRAKVVAEEFSLNAFVEGMMEEFPELKEKLAPHLLDDPDYL